MTEGDEGAGLLAFAPHLRPETVPGDAVYLVSEHQVTALVGEQAAALVPLLDGTRDLRGVLRDAAPRVPPVQSAAVLGRLLRDGLVERRPSQAGPEPDPQAAAYWASAGGPRPGPAAADLLSLHVTAVGSVDATVVRDACRAAGLHLVDDPAHTVLTVVVCEDYLADGLRKTDAAHRAAGRAWLPVKPFGSTVWAGPVFRPEDGPCWTCLAHRLRARYAAHAPVSRLHGGAPVLPPRAALPVTVSLGASLAALRAAHWLAGRRRDQDDLVTFDTLTLTSRPHPVRRRPQCPDCGHSEPPTAPPRLRPRRKTVRTGGGHRAVSAEQILDTYGHLVDPVTGVVKEIRREECGAGPLHVHRAGHNLALGPRHAGQMRGLLRQESSGKGRTRTEAEAGALCEAVERLSGVWQGSEHRVRGSLHALGDQALSPADVQLWHARQFRERDRWNRTGHPFHLVPEPFDPDAVLDWSPVWSLTRDRASCCPAPCCTSRPRPATARRMVRADSNGCAAGWLSGGRGPAGAAGTVERDAVALWWYNMSRQSAVDADTFGDPWTDRVRQAHAELRPRGVGARLTCDLGVPVMAAVSRRTDGTAEDIMFGFGAHLDPAVALTRAVSELNQMLPAVRHARPDGTGYRCADPVAVGSGAPPPSPASPHLRPRPGRSGPRASPTTVTSRRTTCSTTSTALRRRLGPAAWRCSCSTRPAPISVCPWSVCSCPACGTSGRASRPAGSSTSRSGWAGSRNPRRTTVSTPSRCSSDHPPTS